MEHAATVASVPESNRPLTHSARGGRCAVVRQACHPLARTGRPQVRHAAGARGRAGGPPAGRSASGHGAPRSRGALIQKRSIRQHTHVMSTPRQPTHSKPAVPVLPPRAGWVAADRESRTTNSVSMPQRTRRSHSCSGTATQRSGSRPSADSHLSKASFGSCCVAIGGYPDGRVPQSPVCSA